MSYAKYTMDIRPQFRDTFTWIPNHTALSHLGCVLLRCALGLVLLMEVGGQGMVWGWIALCAAVVGFFASKLVLTRNATWKVYTRTMLVYVLVAVLLYFEKRDVAGALIVVDALMGLQSRHMARLLSAI